MPPYIERLNMTKSITALFALLFSFNVFAFEVGETAPCVVLQGVNPGGAKVSGCIRDPLKPNQQFTLIEFFSIADAASREDLPLLSRLADDLDRNATVRVVTIDADTAAVKAFLNAQKSLVNFPVAFDPE